MTFSVLFSSIFTILWWLIRQIIICTIEAILHHSFPTLNLRITIPLVRIAYSWRDTSDYLECAVQLYFPITNYISDILQQQNPQNAERILAIMLGSDRMRPRSTRIARNLGAPDSISLQDGNSNIR